MVDSVELFQGALELWQDEPPLNLTPADQEKALADAEAAVRKTHFNEIQNLRKRGEGFYNAKRAAPGRFLEWQEGMRALYAETGAERGFIWGEKTIENYMNVHRVYLMNDGTYEQYRDFPAWIAYQAYSYHLNGRDPETVPAIAAIRAQSVAAIPETTGGGATVTDCGIPESYPALIAMCESGEISQLEAGRIVDRCAVDGTNERVIQAVQECGVLNTDCVVILENILESMTRAASKGEPFNDVFEEARLTEGYITTADGDQVLLRQLSHREIWAAYVRSRHAANSGSGSGGGAKFKNILNSEIEHAEALAIARDLKDEELIEQLEAEKPDQRFKLKLDKPV
jgi:hypothetical protein